MKQGKIWGNTISLFNKNNVEMHRIEIKKGGICSKHKHEHKFNAFFVEDGQLEIEVWKKDYDLCDKTLLNNGEISIIMPGEYHRFRALEKTIAFEIYWVELSTDDIIRKDHGRIDNDNIVE